MLRTSKLLKTGVAFALILGVGTGYAHADEQTIAEERAQLDQAAGNALDQLFTEEPEVRPLYEQAYGYAVFTNYKFAAGIVAGGGSGVAINKETNERTYMDMGTAGIAAGLGGQKYRLVLLFETAQDFNEFITDSWEATASANAVAGESGANVATNFTEGTLIYPLTDAGLMLNADISGTRFWVDEELQGQAGMTEDRDFFDDEPEYEEELGDDDVLTNEDVLEHDTELGEPLEQQ